MSVLTEPFAYGYMVNAIWVSALVGALCGFLSTFLMLKGWSLIGDALSHAIVPGVAGAYMLGLPFAAGAFLSGGLAAAAILTLGATTRLRQDAVIGVVFTGFFALGLFMISIRPTAVNIQTIMLGNVLAITPADTIQLALIGAVCLLILTLKWRDLLAVFFDEAHARSIGLHPTRLKVLFFALLSAATVAALQTVGAFLVVAMVITPGRDRVAPERPLPARRDDRGGHRRGVQRGRRLSQLLSRRRDRRAHRHDDDHALHPRVRLRAPSRHPRHPGARPEGGRWLTFSSRSSFPSCSRPSPSRSSWRCRWRSCPASSCCAAGR